MFFVILVTSTTVSRAESQFERTLTTALETLSSGVSATAMLGDTEVIVTPLRTWKSISGHYCRRFQVTSAKPASAKVSTESTRCRDNGIWKPAFEG
jgi:hypothetical protein